MAVVSVSLPDDLLARADAFLAERGFAGRSELVRAALRDFLAAQEGPGREGPRSATLTLVYPHGHERKVGEARHEHTDIVRSMMHGHVSLPGGPDARRESAAGAGETCVEVFVLEGPGRRIREFSDHLRAMRETRLVHVVYTDVAPAEDAPSARRRHAH